MSLDRSTGCSGMARQGREPPPRPRGIVLYYARNRRRRGSPQQARVDPLPVGESAIYQAVSLVREGEPRPECGTVRHRLSAVAGTSPRARRPPARLSEQTSCHPPGRGCKTISGEQPGRPQTEEHPADRCWTRHRAGISSHSDAVPPKTEAAALFSVRPPGCVG